VCAIMWIIHQHLTYMKLNVSSACLCVYMCVSLFLMHGHSFERSAQNLACGILILFGWSLEISERRSGFHFVRRLYAAANQWPIIDIGPAGHKTNSIRKFGTSELLVQQIECHMCENGALVYVLIYEIVKMFTIFRPLTSVFVRK